MDELKREFLDFAFEVYNQYVADYRASVNADSCLILPLSYVAFAREETNLFQLLFINDMDLNMTEAEDFYKEAGNEEKARIFSDSLGIEWEFLTTMRYIEKYIKPGDHVLEIGAGTGRYSHALARQGYAVDAVELVEHNIEVFRKNTLSTENITVTQGNALDLSAFPDNEYDITLLLGPLYHL